MKYSDAVSSQGAELTKAQSQAQESGDTVEAASKQIEEEKKKSSSYEALIEAYSALQQQNTDEAALKIQNVYADLLPADLKGIYNTICNTTGTTGIEGTTDATAADGTDSGDSADGAAPGATYSNCRSAGIPLSSRNRGTAALAQSRGG